jgi:carboxymethylenebutenolidase
MSEKSPVTQEMIKLYDDYTHLTLDRRRFMDSLTKLTGSAAAAAAIVPLIAANSAQAAIVPADDTRIVTETVTFLGSSGQVSGYLARPANAAGKLPAVLVIHENRGLNPHIQDVTRRFAVEGFLAFGVDFLSPAGGTPADEDKAREMIGKLDRKVVVADGVAAVDFLRKHEAGNGKVGTVGFCFGGAISNQIAVADPALNAAVVFYGSSPAPEQVPAIKARMLLHYAGDDERINADVPAYEAALKAAGTSYTLHMYEGVNHAFNNDTAAARYNKEAADLAFSRTVAFLKEVLASS